MCDCLSEFWREFHSKCTLGTNIKMPYIRHEYQVEEWHAIARILVTGWRPFRYIPLLLPLPFLEETPYVTNYSSVCLKRREGNSWALHWSHLNLLRKMTYWMCWCTWLPPASEWRWHCWTIVTDRSQEPNSDTHWIQLSHWMLEAHLENLGRYFVSTETYWDNGRKNPNSKEC